MIYFSVREVAYCGDLLKVNGPCDSTIGVYRVPLLGGRPQLLFQANESDPAARMLDLSVSGDGRWLAYINPANGLMVRDVATGAVRQITCSSCDSSDRIRYPVWSSNGQFLSYQLWNERAGGTTQVIEPGLPTSVIRVGSGGWAHSWASVGSNLCMVAVGAYPRVVPPLIKWDLVTNAILGPPVELPVVSVLAPTRRCAFSGLNELAVTIGPSLSQDENHLLFLDQNLRIVSNVGPFSAADIVGWASDSVVLAQVAPPQSAVCTPGSFICPSLLPAGSLKCALIRRDGTVSSVTGFQQDSVVGVIPR